MVCKITSITKRAGCRGVTLVETVISVGVGVLVCAAAIGTLIFSLKSYQALTNYQDMNAKSRIAIDTLSGDIRQASCCSTGATFSATSLTLVGTNAVTGLAYTNTYSYDSTGLKFTRTFIDTNGTSVRVLLTNCTSFTFSYYLRNTTNLSFNVFSNDSGRADLCKLIEVDWTCARSTMSGTNDTRKGESAKIVIRKG